ncbi:MAG TPA: class I adenylate-forming enzyme family protein [Syntrophales bacterium]|nr:class I adenylate-forming enzyme family protein [Syntrophales bacterium]HON23089.1 class I adenylate-forming enzyme family protein [Syntrophales bacterium]HOU77426.1 class I adenylate-forming enzyme family protein [Syntrophales bacterium]HPC33594.1 class I adenylate-forming enzyme family protein [Syntrophales bacterium]HQI35975.1 class I adenylate-forming enzyme family protein [Syntrophales bacterium]
MNEEKRNRCRRMYGELLANQADYPEKYAREKPGHIAIIEHNTGEKVTWKQFNQAINAFAAKLLSVGLKKGDIVATSLPLLKEHVYLMYACYRIGVIVAPLDLRLKSKEILYCFEKMKPRAYFFLGKTPVADFRPLIAEVMKAAPYVRHWVQFQKEKDLIMDGAVGITDFTKDIKKVYVLNLLTGAVKKARRRVDKRDACLIIFTTGSTGSSKPALLCHENILVQNIGLAVGFEMSDGDRMLINLPPSHVGCVTEQLATTIFGGGVAVILHIFDPQKSLEAIQEHKITTLGQIPALFNMEWRLPDYDRFDLSSLRFAIYGGQAVSREFLEKMSRMAPRIGTGLGLTETAGFCTYTDLEATVDDLVRGIGYDMPLCPLTIREPMQSDGTAGREKAGGEVGEICFSGPQIFLGYLADPENTARTISRDGICYTGDLGYYDEQGLHFSGRSKLVIKPKGFQVFPEDVENHIAGKLRGRVGMVACVGVEHAIWSEAIMTFVEATDPQAPVTPADVLDACRDIAAYSRPAHVVVVEAGKMPLNRVAKTDYMVLREMAKEEMARLRAAGQWD